MDEWVAWVIVAVVFAVGEILTLGFFLGPFAIAAAVAAIVSAAGAPLLVSGLVFLVASGAAFLGLRPLVRRHSKLPAQLRTGSAALVGKTATVVERVDADSGCVKLDGEMWSAKSYLDDEVIEPGARVHVMEIRGATALVSE
jgi:membrane protein implicated in regulation of membrane protease activity